MFGDHEKSIKHIVLYLAAIALITLGSYSLGMTTVNVVTNNKYSISQSITGRLGGSAAMLGLPYLDGEANCDEMYGRPYPGITQEERDFQATAKDTCVKRVEEQRRQVRTMDFAHAVLLLAIGGVFYFLSRKHHGQ